MQPHIVLKPGAVTSVTVSSTTAALTTPDTETVGAILTIETGDVRMKWDGENPSASAGALMKADSVWEVTGRDLLVAMRFYAVTVDALVTCAELKGY